MANIMDRESMLVTQFVDFAETYRRAIRFLAASLGGVRI